MKNKWMKWSAKGAENFGTLQMKMKCEEDIYESFVEIMKLDGNIR